MKTLVAANQKGGVGKTSTLVHLAFSAIERGLKTVIIDLDTQANASYTLNEFSSGIQSIELFAKKQPELLLSGNLDDVVLVSANSKLADIEKLGFNSGFKNFHGAIQAFDNLGYDICMIDTPPSLGACMVTALAVGDYVLSPLEMEAYAISGIKQMLTTIANIRKVNKTLKFIGMVPSKVDGRNPRHKRHLIELREAYPDLTLDTKIALRSSIADAMATSTPVWKIKKTAAREAAKEVRALSDLVFSKMEISK